MVSAFCFSQWHTAPGARKGYSLPAGHSPSLAFRFRSYRFLSQRIPLQRSRYGRSFFVVFAHGLRMDRC